jgi:hypothetical protein
MSEGQAQRPEQAGGGEAGGEAERGEDDGEVAQRARVPAAEELGTEHRADVGEAVDDVRREHP